jgi:glycosyltransferase involved in cell wall biosynthesis
MKIHILGTRGIPARYGGFETFAEELSTRLVSRGYEVTVHSRRRFFRGQPLEDYKGVKRTASPTIAHKYLETPLAALTAFLRIKKTECQIILLCNAANSPFAWISRLKGIHIVTNVDGIERHRSKWNSLGKLWYLIGERASVLFSNTVIADAQVIANYYNKNYKINPTVITYGTDPIMDAESSLFIRYNFCPKKYILYVSRLEPENNALGVIQAYLSSKAKLPLVIVGDAPYASEYKQKLYRTAEEGTKKQSGKRIIFTGFRFGQDYHALQANCSLYIQATEVGGTHPALIEAMSYGNLIIANGTPENVEVLADAGLYYEKNCFEQLTSAIDGVFTEEAELVHNTALKEKAKIRASKCYCWEVVTDHYDQLFKSFST